MTPHVKIIPVQEKRMSAKRRKSAAVKPEKLSPIMLVVRASISLGGLGILRLLNILESKELSGISDIIHFCGVFFLFSEVVRGEKTCAGLSLKSLQLTELHMAVKLSYGFVVENHIRFFDTYSFLLTLLVIIYLFGFNCKSSHVDNQHNFKILYLVVPCALLSLVIHPITPDNILIGITIAFCCYLNSILMLPQLEVMRRREILLTQGQSVTFLGYRLLGYYGIRWAFMGLLSELVNGLIFADFCYYYMTLDYDFDVEDDMRLPSCVV